METKKVSPANYTPELIEEIKAGYDPKASESERTMQLQTL